MRRHGRPDEAGCWLTSLYVAECGEYLVNVIALVDRGAISVSLLFPFLVGVDCNRVGVTREGEREEKGEGKGKRKGGYG